MQTYEIVTLSSGAANLQVEGSDILLERDQAGVWRAYLDGQGEPVGVGLTRKICAANALIFFGIPGEVVGQGGRPCKAHANAAETVATLADAPAEVEAKPAITLYSHSRGFTVYGLEMPSWATVAPGKYGRPDGFSCKPEAKSALWAWLQARASGQVVRVVKGKTRSVITLP